MAFSNRISALAAAAALLAACGGGGEVEHAAQGGVKVADGWVRAAPEGRSLTAAYFTMISTDGTDDALLSVVGPSAGVFELHETTHEDGAMRMRQVPEIVVDADGAALEPGGLHLMMIDLAAPLADGDTVDLVLMFRDAGAVPVTLPVKSGAAGH